MSVLTRIKNNQILDSTIYANAKIVPGSIVGSLFNTNLTMTSDVTITGNLTVQGASTYVTIASTNTYVNDPLIVMNNAFAGTNTYDLGFVFNRGTDQNQALIWSELYKEFRLIGTTETGTTYGNVVTSSFANLHVSRAYLEALTSTRIPFVSANKELVDDSNFTYDSAEDILTIKNVQIDGTNNKITTTNSNANLTISPNGTGVVSFDSSRLIDVSDPIDNQDVVTLSYLNTQISSAVTNISEDDSDISVHDNGIDDAEITSNIDGLRVVTYNSNVTAFYGNGAVGESTLFIDKQNGNIVVNGKLYVSTSANVQSLWTDALTTSGPTTLNLTTATALNNTPIGNATPSTGVFTTATAGSVSSGFIGNTGTTFTGASINLSGNVLANSAVLNALTVNGTGVFTTLTATGNIIGGIAQFASLNATPVGNATASTGAFTTLSASQNFYANASIATTAQGIGAVVIPNGGISVAGAANIGSTLTVSGATQLNNTLGVGGITTFTNSTNATSTSDGAVIIQGGASVTKDLYVGGNLYAANIIGVTANVITVEDPLLFLRPSYTFPYNYDIGIYSSFTGTGLTTAGNVLQHTAVIRNNSDNTWTFASNLAEPGAGHVVFGADTVYDPIKAGNLYLVNTTAATTTGTGALIVGGGAGIGGTVVAAQLNSTGNVLGQAGTFNALTVNGSGDVTGLISTAGINSSANILATGAVLNALTVNGTGAFTTLTVTGNIIGGLGQFAAINSTPIGNATASTGAFTTLSATGTTSLVAVNSTGFINTTANVSAAVVNTGTLNATGTTTLVAVNSTGFINTTGNISASRINADTLAATGTIWANATTDTSSLSTGALIVAGGTAVGKTLYVGTGAVFNSTQVSADFQVKGTATTSLIYASAGQGAVVIGGSNTAPQLGSTLKINGTDSLLLPVGSSAQRPSNTGNIDIAGMIRFNNSLNNLEYYTGSDWTTPGAATTLIVDQQFSGNGVQVAFTLSNTATTNGSLVSVNGVIQIPTTAYSVSGTTLTFTEAPAVGDAIDVRILAATSTVTKISDGFSQVNLTTTYANIATGTSSSIVRISVENDGLISIPNGSAIAYDQTVINAPGTNLAQLDSFGTAAYSTAKYLIQIKDGANIESAEVLLTQDTANVLITTYAVLAPAGALGTFSANIVSGSVKFWYIPSISTNANIKVQTTYIV